MKLIKKLIVAFFAVALILLPMGIVLASETRQDLPTMSVDQEDEYYEEYWIFLPVEDGVSYSYDQNAYDSEVSDDEYTVLAYDENDKVSFTVNSNKDFKIVDLDEGDEFLSQRGSGTVEFTMPALDLEVVLCDTQPSTEQTPGTQTDPGKEQQPGIDPPSIDPPEIDPPGIETPGTETQGSGTPETEKPGTETPGTETPGTETPGTESPGTGKDPVTEEKPGVEQDPGTGQEPSTENAEKKSYKVYLREIEGVVTYMYESSHYDKSSNKSNLVLTYKEGETVFVGIETIMTYDFVNKSTGKTMEISNDNGIISFKMPDSDVSIVYTGANQNTTHQTSTTPVYSPELYVYLPVAKDVTYEYNKDNYDEEESDEDYFALRYEEGDAVSFKVNYGGNVKVIRFWDNKEFLPPQKSGQVSFTMPDTDLELVLETEKKDNSKDSSNGNSKVTLSQNSTEKSTTPSLNGSSGSNIAVPAATAKTSTAFLKTGTISGNGTTSSNLGLDTGEEAALSGSDTGLSDVEALGDAGMDAMEDGGSEGMTEDSSENEPESSTEGETENSTKDVEETELETETDNTTTSERTDRNQDGDSYTDGTDNMVKNVNLKVSFDIEPMVGIFVIAALSIQVILLAIFLLAIIVIISNRK